MRIHLRSRYHHRRDREGYSSGFLSLGFRPCYNVSRRITIENEAPEEGFLAELDYTAEAYNAQRFNIEMRNRGLQDVVTVPTVVEELSTTRILTTEWVSGVGLDQSKEGGVPNLCTVALNAYLVMLLETGCLHCGELLLFFSHYFSAQHVIFLVSSLIPLL